jgi:hypothetical protein
MKKILTATVIILSITLLGAKCNKSDQQTDTGQVNIPIELTEENAARAIDTASKELGWPYTYRKPGENSKRWAIEKTHTEDQGHALNHWLAAAKINDPVDWEKAKHDYCNVNSVESLNQSTVTQISLSSPRKGQACLINYTSHDGEKRAILYIFLKDQWIVQVIMPGTSFSDVKPTLDHFLNNLK